MNSLSKPYDAIVVGPIVDLVTFDGHGPPSWEARLERSEVLEGSPAGDAFRIMGLGGSGLCFYVRAPAIGEIWVAYLSEGENPGVAFAYPLAEAIDRDARLRRGEVISVDPRPVPTPQ